MQSIDERAERHCHRADMCADTREDMRADMCADVCTDMRTDIWCVDVCRRMKASAAQL